LICNVNDDPAVIRSTSNSSLDINRTNLPNFQPRRRVERLLPPMGFWNTYGVGKFYLDSVRLIDMFLQFKIQIVGDMN